LQQLEVRCNQRIEHNNDENQTQINNMSQSLLHQMKQDQTSNRNLLRSIIADRDNSMEQKMNENLQAILSKLNGNAISPTRKKYNQAPNMEQEQQDSTMSENDTTTVTDPKNDFLNPYQKTAQQRRSVQNTLPTTVP
jgi:hypothetical protein